MRDRLCGSPRCHARLLSDNSNYFWREDCCSTETLHTVESLQLCSFLLLLLICSWEGIFQKDNRNRKCKQTQKISTSGRAAVCFHYCGELEVPGLKMGKPEARRWLSSFFCLVSFSLLFCLHQFHSSETVSLMNSLNQNFNSSFCFHRTGPVSFSLQP